MFNERSIEAVNRSRYLDEFRRPLYDSYCLSRLPDTVAWLLRGDGLEATLPIDVLGGASGPFTTVITLFLDAFGWSLFERLLTDLDHPLLDRIEAEGAVSKLTSVFPSTTTAMVHAFATGLLPAESGVFEWRQYDDRVRRVISPLPFSYVDPTVEKQPGKNALLGVGWKPEWLYAYSPLYDAFFDQGIAVVEALPSEVRESVFDRALSRGVVPLAFKSLEEGADLIAREARREGRRWLRLYRDGFDALGHEFGQSSAEVLAEAKRVFDIIEERVVMPLRGTGNVLLMIHADHGQIEVDPSRTIHLDDEARFPGLLGKLKTTRSGLPIYPCGSLRDVFLHVRDEQVEEVRAELTDKLGDLAHVAGIEDLFAAGIFGPTPLSAVAPENFGNLVVVPRGNDAIFFKGPFGQFDRGKRGEHGGLSVQEMDTAFIALAL